MQSGRKRDNPWHKVLRFGLEYFGKFYSSYPGFVIDTDDPENRGRLVIGVPSVDGTNVNPKWAEPLGQWGGDDYGIHITPSQGDMVWVSYRNGDSRYPTWQMGSFPKKGDGIEVGKPAEFSNEFIYGFKTPRGNIILIDDATGDDNGGDSYIEILHHNNGKVQILDAKMLFETDEFKTVVKNALIEATDSVKLGSNAVEPAVKGTTLETHINNILTNQAASGVYLGAAFLPVWNAAAFTALQSSTSAIKSNKVKVE